MNYEKVWDLVIYQMNYWETIKMKTKNEKYQKYYNKIKTKLFNFMKNDIWLGKTCHWVSIIISLDIVRIHLLIKIWIVS